MMQAMTTVLSRVAVCVAVVGMGAFSSGPRAGPESADTMPEEIRAEIRAEMPEEAAKFRSESTARSPREPPIPEETRADAAALDGASVALPSAGIALHGTPKYPAGFDHFDYAYPDAPKGGEMRLSALGRFDNLNPFILKGVAASGLDYLFETLMRASEDEPMSQYPLIAQAVAIGHGEVTFTLRPQARFHDNSPITAEDVAFSFDTLMKDGHPFYKSYFRQIEKAEVLGSHRVRFVFRDQDNRELPFILGTGLPILSKKWWSGREFGKTTLTPPMGSGPYRIASVDHPRSITYTRLADYWGRDLPVNRGRYNMDRITIDYFRDSTVALEAFKSGEYDFRFENQAKAWATAYDFPAVRDGLVIVETIDHDMPSGMQGFVFNTRKDIFADPRVRQALILAYDFEWANRNLFHGAYRRSHSYFSNSELAATGRPDAGEQALLAPWRDRIAPDVWTTAYRSPSTIFEQESNPARGLRINLRKARRLLAEAGWHQGKDGVLRRDSDQTPMRFELLIRNPQFERVAAPYLRILEKLGIDANMRILQDDSQYQGRMEDFDFDMNVWVFPSNLSPGNELVDTWTGTAADTPGSRNVAGVRDPAVDAMVGHVLAAQTREELVTASRALDRLLQWGHYTVPHWHLGLFRVAWWNKFSRPAIWPRYAFTLDFWWWDGQKARVLAEREAALDSSDDHGHAGRYWLLVILGGILLMFWWRCAREPRRL